MALLDVPSEILYDILARTVHSTGLRPSIQLRLVCWEFCKLTESAIFNFSLCEINREGISKQMAARLIISKLRQGNPNERPLCHAIAQTTNYLISTVKHKDALQQVFDELLAAAAAQSMFLWNLVSKLEPKDNEALCSQTIKNAALIAAIRAKQVVVVRDLLELGADAAAKTLFFGEPLASAARIGCTDILQLLLLSRDWTASGEYFARLRYKNAIEAAAETGQMETLLMLLELNDEQQLTSTHDCAIIKATRAAEESTARLLLCRRSPKSHLSKNKSFWLHLVRTMVRGNCQDFLQETWNEASVTIGNGSLGLLLEDACRLGHVGVVQFLLTNASDLSHNDFNGSLFWAARSGYTVIVDILIEFLDANDRTIIKALAGAASGKQHDLFCHLLGRTSIQRTENSLPIQFSDAIHLIYPHLPPRTPRSIVNDDSSLFHRCQTAEEKATMEHAITSGNLEGVVAILCKHPAEHPNNSPDLLLGTFPNAARNNHPDILLYLCENREPHFLSQCAESTAILQLFVDFGWDINESDTGVHHPRFAYAAIPSSMLLLTQTRQFVHDEHLTRWLLSIGADPTARADYDVTATSIAAIHSSFSIFELLLERSGNVDNGQLLHRAIKRDDPDQLEFIELLLDLGCPIDAIQYENHPWSRMMHKAIGAGTPLFDAAARGKTDVVKYLRQRGANPAIKNTHGKTVLQIAEEGGHIEIVDIIKGWDH